MNIGSLFHDQKGATIVIVALSMTVIMIICSLALDFGLAYNNASLAQNAIDAAVLAAGRNLPVSPDDETKKNIITDTAREYLNKNGIVDTSTMNIDYKDLKNSKYTGLGVSLTVNSKMYFSRILGVNSLNITKSGEVKMIPSVKISDVVPLGIKKTNLDDAIASGNFTGIQLKYPGGTGGDFGAIDLDGVKGGGANDYERWLTFGYTPELGIGTELFIESGNMAGPTSAFNTRYNACTHFPSSGGCTWEHFVSTCPRVIKIPVVESIPDRKVKVVAFAAFVLELPSQTNDYVTGSYINIIIPGTPASTEADINETDYGIYNLRLSK